VIGSLVSGDHPAGNVLEAGALDPSRRPHPARPAVQQQRNHHRRLVGRAAVAVLAIGRVERRRVHHADGVDHEPRQGTFGSDLGIRPCVRAFVAFGAPWEAVPMTVFLVIRRAVTTRRRPRSKRGPDQRGSCPDRL
jgi:hypothetical protein